MVLRGLVKAVGRLKGLGRRKREVPEGLGGVALKEGEDEGVKGLVAGEGGGVGAGEDVGVDAGAVQGDAGGEEGWAEVVVKQMNKADVVVRVPGSGTVGDLKAAVAAVSGVEVGRQRLIYRGKVLKEAMDGMAMGAPAVGVTDGVAVHLVERAPGGSAANDEPSPTPASVSAAAAARAAATARVRGVAIGSGIEGRVAEFSSPEGGAEVVMGAFQVPQGMPMPSIDSILMQMSNFGGQGRGADGGGASGSLDAHEAVQAYARVLERQLERLATGPGRGPRGPRGPTRAYRQRSRRDLDCAALPPQPSARDPEDGVIETDHSDDEDDDEGARRAMWPGASGGGASRGVEEEALPADLPQLVSVDSSDDEREAEGEMPELLQSEASASSVGSGEEVEVEVAGGGRAAAASGGQAGSFTRSDMPREGEGAAQHEARGRLRQLGSVLSQLQTLVANLGRGGVLESQGRRLELQETEPATGSGGASEEGLHQEAVADALHGLGCISLEVARLLRGAHIGSSEDPAPRALQGRSKWIADDGTRPAPSTFMNAPGGLGQNFPIGGSSIVISSVDISNLNNTPGRGPARGAASVTTPAPNASAAGTAAGTGASASAHASAEAAANASATANANAGAGAAVADAGANVNADVVAVANVSAGAGAGANVNADVVAGANVNADAGAGANVNADAGSGEAPPPQGIPSTQSLEREFNGAEELRNLMRILSLPHEERERELDLAMQRLDADQGELTRRLEERAARISAQVPAQVSSELLGLLPEEIRAQLQTPAGPVGQDPQVSPADISSSNSADSEMRAFLESFASAIVDQHQHQHQQGQEQPQPQQPFIGPERPQHLSPFPLDLDTFHRALFGSPVEVNGQPAGEDTPAAAPGQSPTSAPSQPPVQQQAVNEIW